MVDSEEEAEQDKKEVYEAERNKGLHINDVITWGRAGRGRPKDNR